MFTSKLQSNKKFIFYFILALVLSGYSFSVGQWKIFPHSILKNIVLGFEKQSEETVAEEIVGEETDYGEKVDLGNFEKSDNNKTYELNNFEFTWQTLSVGIEKVAAAELIDRELWYVNQSSPKLIEYLSLTNATESSVKGIFSIGGKRYVYVAYKENECASARIVSLIDKSIALQFSCLPVKDSVMSSVGGAWLRISDNEILMTTGTPTNVNGSEISKEAQLDESLWGKILRIEVKNNEFIVDVFSKGHRNPQGITKIKDTVIAAEHGPRGGDEINIILENGNYGWPTQSLGSGYNLESINKSYDADNISTNLPLFSFVPSIGISDAQKCPTEYSEYYSPNSCVAVASMRGGSIYFLIYNEDKALFTEKLEFGTRIRKFFVQENSIIALTDYEGVIVGELIKLTYQPDD